MALSGSDTGTASASVSNNAAPAASNAAASVSGTIPSGTPLVVSLSQELDSKHAEVGQTFGGTLVSPLTVGDRVVAPAGSKVLGKVTEVHQARRLLGRKRLSEL